MAVPRPVLAMLVIHATTSQVSSAIFRKLPTNDVIFQDNLLFQCQARTKVECAIRCTQYVGCETFTFSKNLVPTATCRGHSKITRCNVTMTSQPDTSYYLITDSDANAAGSCRDVQILQPGSGVRQLNVTGNPLTVSAYCDQVTDGGCWMVIQRRQDGSVNFNCTWADYQAGFGDPAGEYWLGFDTLYRMTTRQRYEIRFDLQMFNGTTGFAVYSDFSVGPGSDFYSLSVGVMTAGNVADKISESKGLKFTTWDRNNGLGSSNCAFFLGGGWWYKGKSDICSGAYLNNPYRPNSSCPTDQTRSCPMWRTFGEDDKNSLQKVAMKIRPLDG